MSLISRSLRELVVLRAGGRCEYCHLSTEGQVATFPIDHVKSIVELGETVLENLALSCPNCNGHKWKYVEAIDPVSKMLSPLFNPRTQKWHEHFEWDISVNGLLVGKTACGRTTIVQLGINSPEMLKLRRFLFELGLFDELPSLSENPN